MQYKKLRDLMFPIHRYVGLVVGLILVVIGLTGSLLVFHHEIDHSLLSLRNGHITPQGEPVAIQSVLDNVKTTYSDRPEFKDFKIDGIETKAGEPYSVGMSGPKEQWLQVFVNPYTGTILSSRVWDKSFFGIVYKIHYELLAGQIGRSIAGIAALLLLVLSITGLVLWPGWRRLMQGFKIKWHGHIKRVHFDIHKVVGVVATVFLALIGFTGFMWNFWEYTEPALYTATLSQKPPEPVSKLVTGKAAMGLDDILRRSDAALPGAATTYISVPTAPEGTFHIWKKFPQEREDYNNEVFLDQFSGEVLRVKDSSKSLPVAERIIATFGPVHFGTFGGLPTRIFYVFIGLTPTVLMVTGFVMWKHRYRGRSRQEVVRQLAKEL